MKLLLSLSLALMLLARALEQLVEAWVRWSVRQAQA